VTPRNTEYTKYDPPGAQVSDDALAQKYLLYTPPARLKLRYRSLRAYFYILALGKLGYGEVFSSFDERRPA
jgi:hypothetical protein